MTLSLHLKQLSRHRTLKFILLLINLFILALFVSCKKEKEISPATSQPQVMTSPSTTGSTGACGQPSTNILYAGQTMEAGTVVISNDARMVYVTYTTTNGWKLLYSHLYIGALANVPLNNSGNPQIGLLPSQTDHSPGVTSYTYSFPLQGLPDCFIVAAHAEVAKTDAGGSTQTQTAWGNGTGFNAKGSWAMYMNYCKQACQTCLINAGDFHTQTQGAWGAAPNGNNWGSYLHQHFQATFPAGVTIGSTYHLTFTTADAITTFLPQGGTPAALTASSVDPADVSNVLAGQVLTLTLSIGFANADAAFQKSDAALGSLKISEGPFAGKTVAAVLQEANEVLGGSSTAHTPADMNAVITRINENFDNGTVNNGFLICP